MRTFRYVFPVPDASPSARLTFPFPFRPVLDVHCAYVQQLCSHDAVSYTHLTLPTN